MSIKVNGATVITNSRRGVFRTVNPGSYTTADRPPGASEGDVIYDTDEKTILVWNGTEWVAAGGGGGNTFYLFLNGNQSTTALSYTLDLRPYQKIISVSTLICTKGQRGTNGGGRYNVPAYGQPFSNGGAGGDGPEIYADIRQYDGIGYPTNITFSTDLTTVQGYSTATRISDAAADGGAGGVGHPDNRAGARDGDSTTSVTTNLEPWSFYVNELTGQAGGDVDNSIKELGTGGGGGSGWLINWQPNTELFTLEEPVNGKGFGGGGSGGNGQRRGDNENDAPTPGQDPHNGFILMAITAEIDDDTRSALISLLATQPDIDFFGIAESRIN